MSIKRRMMKFLIPLSVSALGRNDLVGRAAIPLYINPESFKITEQKQVTNNMTKGGYIIQYWGEQLSTIQVSGTTGSGGIEAINILRDIYRNEIIQFNNILRERAANQQQDFVTAFGTIGNLNRSANFGNGLLDIFDDLTQGGTTGIATGLKSNIDNIIDAASGIADQNPISLELVPTTGAFATCLILYWHGEKFQGYFTNFDVDEMATSPGHFSYNFSFTILKRSGSRTNFMPWHRKSKDSNGNPVPASLPKEGPRPDELSFPATYTQVNVTGYQPNPRDPNISKGFSTTSTFNTGQASENDANNVGTNRRGIFRGN
jgi:hypothetical protein